METLSPTSDSMFIMDERAHGTLPGYRSGCKCAECKAAWATYMREWSAKNRDKERQRAAARWRNQTPEQRAARNAWLREYMANNPEQRAKALERQRERRKDPEYRRAVNEKLYINWQRDPSRRALAYRKHMLKKKYGLTLAQFEAMLETQGGTCAICEREQIGMNLHVDHCHQTGRVRGLLCSPCNTAIGQFGDDPDRLVAAMQYLIKHGQQKAS